MNDATLADRIKARSRVAENGCWIFQGPPNPKSGYCKISVRGSSHAAHRAAYEAFVGPIPEGMHLDHTCHTRDTSCPGGRCTHRRCVNPAHLEAVTQAENNARSQSSSSRNAQKTHCANGHEFTPENTITRYRSGVNGPRQWRSCRTCEAAYPKVSASDSRSARIVRRSHCAKGHEYTPENTIIKPYRDGSPGYERVCRECKRERNRRFDRRRRARELSRP